LNCVENAVKEAQPQNEGCEIAKHENATQNCRGGTCETWKMWHKNAAVEKAGKCMESHINVNG